MDSILDPPGLPWGSLLAPKMVATCLEIPPGAPKSRSKDLFFGSKRRKRGFQKRGQKRDPPKAFDRVQDRPKMECPAECAGPVLAHLSLLRPEYEQHSGSTPCSTGGGRRIAHAHSAGPGLLGQGASGRCPGGPFLVSWGAPGEPPGGS